jgi:hypothetical protein
MYRKEDCPEMYSKFELMGKVQFKSKYHVIWELPPFELAESIARQSFESRNSKNGQIYRCISLNRKTLSTVASPPPPQHTGIARN